MASGTGERLGERNGGEDQHRVWVGKSDSFASWQHVLHLLNASHIESSHLDCADGPHGTGAHKHAHHCFFSHFAPFSRASRTVWGGAPISEAAEFEALADLGGLPRERWEELSVEAGMGRPHGGTGVGWVGFDPWTAVSRFGLAPHFFDFSHACLF